MNPIFMKVVEVIQTLFRHNIAAAHVKSYGLRAKVRQSIQDVRNREDYYGLVHNAMYPRIPDLKAVSPAPPTAPTVPSPQIYNLDLNIAREQGPIAALRAAGLAEGLQRPNKRPITLLDYLEGLERTTPEVNAHILSMFFRPLQGQDQESSTQWFERLVDMNFSTKEVLCILWLALEDLDELGFGEKSSDRRRSGGLLAGSLFFDPTSPINLPQNMARFRKCSSHTLARRSTDHDANCFQTGCS